ncbi:hypothetical protein CAEBREN_11309 [Caenorhabditis brenneri]|uniref:SPK domain-containing protein n=1 Tax=Caenorhabditis brenneri TaxID=135651 RepID=G0NBP8_CAEBE|nr:hypothetical protein CAEBREN_11309 [Caenorhabditis brenneri]
MTETDHDHYHITDRPLDDYQYLFAIRFFKYIHKNFNTPTPRRDVLQAYLKDTDMMKPPGSRHLLSNIVLQNMVKVTVRIRETHPTVVFVMSIPMDDWIGYNMTVTCKSGLLKKDEHNRMIQYESLDGQCKLLGNHDFIDGVILLA